MQILKDYCAATRRINRKIFIYFVLAYLLLGILASAVYMTNGKMAEYMKSVMEISQEQAHHTISAEDAQQQLHALEANLMAATPFWQYILSFLFTAAFVPAIAMRLRDLNWNPKFASIVLIMPILGPLAKSGHAEILGFIMLGLSVLHLIFLLLLVFIKGTKGANKYGADPLELKIAAV